MQISHPLLMTAPASKPVTTDEAKRQCEIASDDDTYNDQLDAIINAATEQFESDTELCLISRAYYVQVDSWPLVIDLPKRPLQAVSAVKYYDTAGTLQTLSSSVYSVNLPARRIELAVDQVWPTTQDRWDAIKVEYTAGHANAAACPASAKHAILLLVGYYFGQNRGDNDRANDMVAYRRIVQQFLRSSYP